MNQIPSLISARNRGRRRWLNSSLKIDQGPALEIKKLIPEFERRSFGLACPDDSKTCLNKHLDTIVRKPIGESEGFIPVGVVSKDYVLIPHIAVWKAATSALEKAKIDLTQVDSEIGLTEYGERMALSFYLPHEYDHDPSDGNPMRLRLECFNSVDGSMRFRALVGWFRLVCSNGMVVGVTKADFRRRHFGDMTIADVRQVLNKGLSDSVKDKERIKTWEKFEVAPEILEAWMETTLLKMWGFKATARAYHIATTGYDAELIPPLDSGNPIYAKTRYGRQVPGSPERASNAFDISQILAWLAKERNDLQEQVEWRNQIPKLMANLLKG
ncbi:MAG: DUF932 domain-containing protein [Candidatus Sumerlaeota bacterium]|nr:DUF932 domain-containing protein [Candidatus Sumerlaeota bacterium]